MPPDTVYITILRDPVALFASMFSYYDMKKMYKGELSNIHGANESNRFPAMEQ